MAFECCTAIVFRDSGDICPLVAVAVEVADVEIYRVVAALVESILVSQHLSTMSFLSSIGNVQGPSSLLRQLATWSEIGLTN